MTPAPGQTVGPFFHIGLPYDGGNELVPPSSPGAVRLHGRVFDGDGNPVPDAVIEIWQAGPDGAVVQQAGSLKRDGWTFTGFGRAQTTPDGEYWFSTLAPGGENPFIAVTVFARGLLDRLFTRAYLPSVDLAAVLPSLPAERRATMQAQWDGPALLFDIRLQGEGETVFLSFPRQR